MFVQVQLVVWVNSHHVYVNVVSSQFASVAFVNSQFWLYSKVFVIEYVVWFEVFSQLVVVFVRFQFV